MRLKLILALLLIVLVTALVILFGFALIAFYALRGLWRRTQPDQIVLRGFILAVAGLGLIMSSLFVLRLWAHDTLLGRVPYPLVVASVEYRLEESWGTGFLPGDNETGFVVYQLTQETADWARQQGSSLGNMLKGTQREWKPTPVDDSSDARAARLWHHSEHFEQMMSETRHRDHHPTIGEYLDQYGFMIPIEDGKDDEANQSLRSPGSFYAYGNGGSVTIVDPARGKVYFAYAG